jgi:hypothetical protein
MKKILFSLIFLISLVIITVNVYAQENQTTINIDNAWIIATTENCCHLLPTDLQMEYLQLDRENPGLLEDMTDASETCEALKHYGDLDKNTNCKNWYQTKWKFWKKLNR